MRESHLATADGLTMNRGCRPSRALPDLPTILSYRTWTDGTTVAVQAVFCTIYMVHVDIVTKSWISCTVLMLGNKQQLKEKDHTNFWLCSTTPSIRQFPENRGLSYLKCNSDFKVQSHCCQLEGSISPHSSWWSIITTDTTQKLSNEKGPCLSVCLSICINSFFFLLCV